jgi:tRNA A37 methylthiotransferase MiaB
MPDDIERVVKKIRLAAVDELQQGIQTRNNAKLVGSTYDVLVEGRKRGKLHGRNRGDKLIYLNTPKTHESHGFQNPQPGQTISVEVVSSSPWSLEAELAPAEYASPENHENRVNKEKVPVA